MPSPVLVALLALAAPLSAAEPPLVPVSPPGAGFLYTRPVAVTAPGWVQVPLDWTTLRHLTSGGGTGGDLKVVSPRGREVASRVAPYLPGREEEAGNAPEPSLAVTSREADCSHPAATRTVCRLPLPAAGQVIERLSLEIGDVRGAGGEIGYRLYEPREARWRPLAEGVWPAGGPHAIDLPPEPVDSDTLRLEIYGTTAAAPELKSWSAEAAVPTVLFQAEEAGTYLLAYGGGAGGRRELPRRDRPPGGAVTWVTPAAEQEHPPPPLPAPASEPGNPLGATRFTASWKVVAPEARPGGLVRLEVPAGVYGPAHPDLSDLRLAAGDRQIPYLRWSPEAPVLVRETAAEPVRSWDRRSDRGQGGASRIDIDLPQTGLPLTQLLLSTPPMPLRRGLVLRYLEPARPAGDTAEGEERVAARQVWECLPRSPLPCRALLPLSGRAPRLLDLRFEDGDNPPLGGLDLSLWRRSDVLVFVWPEPGEVRLLAGAKNLKAPDYDLAALGDQLLVRPWRPAEIDRSGAAAPAPRWTRWVMPVTLGLAALLFIFLLRRSLKAATS